MREIKNSITSLDSYNVQLFAFFNNEYVMRHILYNEGYRECREYVLELKKNLKLLFKDKYRETHADFFIDKFAFYKEGAEYDLYSYLLNLRMQQHSAMHGEDGLSILDPIYDRLVSDSYHKDYFSKLAEISAQLGVYVTRFDVFDKKEYSTEMINEQNISSAIEKIFFKKTATEKLLSDTLHAESAFAHQTLIQSDLDVSGHIAIYVNPQKESFNLEDTMNKIKIIISLFAGEYQNEGPYEFRECATSYYNFFFNPTRMKKVSSEIFHRLLALRMWDMVRGEKITKKSAFLKLMETFKSQNIKEKCLACSSCELCSEMESCLRVAYKHYQATDESIKNGSLQKISSATS